MASIHREARDNGWTCGWKEGCPYLIPENFDYFNTKNIDIVKLIIHELGKSEYLITFVTDRKGHNLRYAIDSTKIHNELGWLPETKFADGIKKSIAWYLDNRQWWKRSFPGNIPSTMNGCTAIGEGKHEQD